MIITIQHVKKVNYCFKGAKRWFETHDLDWDRFIKEGIDEAILLATGCRFAEKVIEVAHG